VRRLVAEGTIAALVLVAATVVATWPLALHPTTHLSGHIDSFFSTWRLAWIADALRTPGLSLFNAPIFHPEPRTFAYSDAILLPGVLAAPLRYAGVAPVLVYHIVLLTAIVSGGLGVFVLVKYLTGRGDAAVVAAVIFALSPHRLDHLDHLEMQFAVFMPLALLAWHRVVDGGTARLAAVAVILVVLQWLSCIYYALLFAPVLVAVMIVEWRGVDPARRRPVLAGMAAAGLAGAIAIGAYSVPYLQNRQQTGDRPDRDLVSYSAMPGDYRIVHPRNRLYGPVLQPPSWDQGERYLFPGLLPVGLALAGVVAGGGRRRWVYVMIGVIAFDLSLGINGLFFPVLRQFLLPYRGLRAPARAGVLVVMAMAVLAGWAMAAMLPMIRRRASRWAAVAACVAALVVEFRAGTDLWDAPPPLRSPQFGIDHKAVLLEMPLPHPERIHTTRDSYFMMRRIGAWPRLLNGSTGYMPESYRMMLERLVDFPDDRSIAEIRRLGTTHLTIHERWLGQARFEAWLADLMKRPGLNYAGLEPGDGDYRIAIFAVIPPRADAPDR
jgi:hypothetical protein